MKTELKHSIKYPAAMAAFSIAALIFGALSAFLGELLIALSIAPLAALMIFENREKRILSYIVPALVLIVSFLICGPLSVIGAEIVIASVVIAVAYTRGTSKAECVLWLTVVMALMITASLAFAAMTIPIATAEPWAISKLLHFSME